MPYEEQTPLFNLYKTKVSAYSATVNDLTLARGKISIQRVILSIRVLARAGCTLTRLPLRQVLTRQRMCSRFSHYCRHGNTNLDLCGLHPCCRDVQFDLPRRKPRPPARLQSRNRPRPDKDRNQYIEKIPSEGSLGLSHGHNPDASSSLFFSQPSM